MEEYYSNIEVYYDRGVLQYYNDGAAYSVGNVLQYNK